MDVLPGAFYSPSLVLVALLAAGPVVAGEQGVLSLTHTAERAAVVAYIKQREQRGQRLSGDDAQRVQGIGQALLAAQAGVANTVADEALRRQVNALHAELQQATVGASQPRISDGGEITDANIGTFEELPMRAVKMRIENGRPVATSEDQRPNNISALKAGAIRPGVNKLGRQDTNQDRYRALRARIDAMQPNLNVIEANGPVRGNGNTAQQHAAVYSAQMAAKARQLSDAVRAAIDAEPTAGNQRQLAALRERLREKNLDQVLSEGTIAAKPATPTITTLIHHR